MKFKNIKNHFKKGVNILNVKPNTFELLFPYEKEDIGFVKSLPYRRYNPETKTWSIDTKSLITMIGDIPPGLNNLSVQLIINGSTFKLSDDIFIKDTGYSRMIFNKDAKDAFEVAKILKKNHIPVKIKIKNVNCCNQQITLEPNNFNLYPYQEDAVSFLKNKEYSGILALDMGLGKTITSLEAFRRSPAKNLLIVAPASLLQQWKSTIKKFYNYAPVVLSSKVRKEDRDSLWDNPIVITSFDMIRNELSKKPSFYDMVIIDEASYIKNISSQRVQALKSIISKYRISLTGTPIENKLEELFTISDFTVPGFWGSWTEFKNKYMEFESIHIGRNEYVDKLIGYKNLQLANTQLKNLAFRRTKEEVEMDLPDKIEIERCCILTPEERKIYNTLNENLLSDKEILNILINDNKLNKGQDERIAQLVSMQVFASNSKLKMDKISKSSKIQLLEDILTNEISSHKKVIVFTRFKRNFNDFQLIDGDFRSLFLSSDNSQDIDLVKEEFIKSDERTVLFMTDVGQYGTDGLQVASALINFDLHWNPAKMAQRNARIWRLGSNNDKAIIINLTTEGTIDSQIKSVLNKKQKLADVVLR